LTSLNDAVSVNGAVGLVLTSLTGGSMLNSAAGTLSLKGKTGVGIRSSGGRITVGAPNIVSFTGFTQMVRQSDSVAVGSSTIDFSALTSNTIRYIGTPGQDLTLTFTGCDTTANAGVTITLLNHFTDGSKINVPASSCFEGVAASLTAHQVATFTCSNNDQATTGMVHCSTNGEIEVVQGAVITTANGALTLQSSGDVATLTSLNNAISINGATGLVLTSAAGNSILNAQGGALTLSGNSGLGINSLNNAAGQMSTANGALTLQSSGDVATLTSLNDAVSVNGATGLILTSLAGNSVLNSVAGSLTLNGATAVTLRNSGTNAISLLSSQASQLNGATGVTVTTASGNSINLVATAATKSFQLNGLVRNSVQSISVSATTHALNFAVVTSSSAYQYTGSPSGDVTVTISNCVEGSTFTLINALTTVHNLVLASGVCLNTPAQTTTIAQAQFITVSCSSSATQFYCTTPTTVTGATMKLASETSSVSLAAVAGDAIVSATTDTTLSGAPTAVKATTGNVLINAQATGVAKVIGSIGASVTALATGASLLNVVNGALTLTGSGGVATLRSLNNALTVNGATGLTLTSLVGSSLLNSVTGTVTASTTGAGLVTLKSSSIFDLGAACSYAVYTDASQTLSVGAGGLTITGGGIAGCFVTPAGVSGGSGTTADTQNHCSTMISSAVAAAFTTANTVDVAGVHVGPLVASDLQTGGTAGTYTPGTYTATGATTLYGPITLDGVGWYVFQINGNFDVTSAGTMTLINGALAKQVLFVVTGTVTINNGCTVNAIVLATGAISIDRSTVNGAVFSTASTVSVIGATATTINLQSQCGLVMQSVTGAATLSGPSSTSITSSLGSVVLSTGAGKHTFANGALQLNAPTVAGVVQDQSIVAGNIAINFAALVSSELRYTGTYAGGVAGTIILSGCTTATVGTQVTVLNMLTSSGGGAPLIQVSCDDGATHSISPEDFVTLQCLNPALGARCIHNELRQGPGAVAVTAATTATLNGATGVTIKATGAATTMTGATGVSLKSTASHVLIDSSAANGITFGGSTGVTVQTPAGSTGTAVMTGQIVTLSTSSGTASLTSTNSDTTVRSTLTGSTTVTSTGTGAPAVFSSGQIASLTGATGVTVTASSGTLSINTGSTSGKFPFHFCFCVSCIW